MLNPITMRSSRKPQFTRSAPPRARNTSLPRAGWEFRMTGAILLRKMNPPRKGQVPQPSAMLVAAYRAGRGKTCGGVARLKERTPRPGGGVTEERKNEEAQVGSGVGVGYGVGGAASSGAGGDKEGAAETGAKPFAGGAGTVERNRAEADYHRGGFAGG